MDALCWSGWEEGVLFNKSRHSSSTSRVFLFDRFFGYCCCCCHHNVFVSRSPKKAQNEIRDTPKRKSQSPNSAIMINFTFNGLEQPTNYHNYAYIYPNFDHHYFLTAVFDFVLGFRDGRGNGRGRG